MKTNEQLIAEEQALLSMLAQGTEKMLRAIPGVIHVSTGLKEKNGEITDQLCIRVYVEEKKTETDIPAGQIIPKEINGYPTDVNVVAQSFQFLADNARYRPVKGGIQISNRIIALNAQGNGTTLSRGTLGCVAFADEDNAPVILSNWHVLYANTGRDGDRIYQPSPTSIPPVSLLNLPMRPADDDNADMIAKNRRSSITNKTDAAIAVIDVSSCCGCCGIHYSNEINNLSVSQGSGQPARPAYNTIVGKQVAASGMVVFKVGQSTRRVEGRVVDPNYPTFTITQHGNSYTFTGQIAISHTNTSMSFSDHGDSGSVIINSDNKIIGLLFSGGNNITHNGVTYAHLTLANHIDDVIAGLRIHFRFSNQVQVNSGQNLFSDASVQTPAVPVHPAYLKLREKLLVHPFTALLFDSGAKHREEIMYLVNHCRPVTVAWQRNKGPAWLAVIMSAVRDERDILPEETAGVSLNSLLQVMYDALIENGSEALKTDLAEYGRELINAGAGNSLNKIINGLQIIHTKA
ncbi:MAG: hypothetical protein MUC87_09040 [Bacteroidia bacterium]|jgi:hypothetical protein|nr:hypothetical protein [Bacteroidia bacterium]